MKNCSLEVGHSKEPENDNLNLRNRSEREREIVEGGERIVNCVKTGRKIKSWL